MGKDNTKTLSNNSINRLHSPWLLNENTKKTIFERSGFGHFSKNDDIEVDIDKDISQAISQLDKQQVMKRIKDAQDEDEDNDFKLLNQAKSLDLYSPEDSGIYISESDLQLESILRIPEDQHIALLTLKDKIALKVNGQDDPSPLCASNPKVQKIYKKIGFQLARYHSFKKLPKALKIIPSLSNWDEIILLTNPPKWTPQAVYDVTLTFIANLKGRQTQQFYQFILLPLTRQNLMAKGVLDQPILFALQKAMASHPGIFMKGFLFPLCDSNSCTVQEAMTLASIISQTKMSKVDPAPPLLYLSDKQPITLPISVLVLALLKKKQLMSQRVVEKLASRYFSGQSRHNQLLPLVWYQSLLVYLQSYHMHVPPLLKNRLVNVIHRAPQSEVSDILKSMVASWRPEDYRDEEEDGYLQHDFDSMRAKIPTSSHDCMAID